ncbi:hypothetical protein PI125_g11957 [Phytophthora idaei]|nr:hypothetical protein PI125_g11957 [Phytophthora idaei]
MCKVGMFVFLVLCYGYNFGGTVAYAVEEQQSSPRLYDWCSAAFVSSLQRFSATTSSPQSLEIKKNN